MRREMWDFREFLELNCFPQSWQLNEDFPSRWLLVWNSMISLARFPWAVLPQTVQATLPSARISIFSDCFCFISTSAGVGEVSIEEAAGYTFSTFEVFFLCVAGRANIISPSSLSSVWVSSPSRLVSPSSWYFWAIARNCSSCSWCIQSPHLQPDQTRDSQNT